MGIHNLLPFVKKACRQGNINELAGHSVAVDVSCLLHRGLFGCADRVAQGIDTDFYVRYVMKYVKTLLSIHCHVILVFDGKLLPAKQDTNVARREKRVEQKRKGEQLLSEGRTSEAFDCFKRSTTITEEVVHNTIEAFRGMEMVDVLVSPYESDAQLAFLTQTGMAHAVVTEDSDLIAFGCERIIFKMDTSGLCTVYERSELPKCLCKSLADNFDFTKFRRICILAGCDYLQSGLPGVGLTKAATFMSKTSGNDLQRILPRLPRYLNMSNLKIKKEFIADAIRAENTFLYQVVYDPRQRRQRPLNEYPGNDGSPEDEDVGYFGIIFVGIEMRDGSQTDYSYAGEIMSPTTALRMALGNTPSGPSITDKFKLPAEIPEWSIWNAEYRCGAQRMTAQREEQKTKKEACGAFKLTTLRKVKKTTVLESSDGINKEVTVLDTSIEEIDADDDFVVPAVSKPASQPARTGSIKDFFGSQPRDNKAKRLTLKVANSRSAERSSNAKMTKRSNGACNNWNCDDLLRMYALDPRTPNSNASPSSSQQSTGSRLSSGPSQDMNDAGTEEDCCEVIEEQQPAPSSADEQSSAREQSSAHCEPTANCELLTANLKREHSPEPPPTPKPSRTEPSCSSYFKGTRMSGLSRRSMNPFKKPKILKDADTSGEESAKSEAQPSENCNGMALPNAANTAYRASGLLRTLSASDL